MYNKDHQEQPEFAPLGGSGEELRQVLSSAAGALLVLDPQGRVTFASGTGLPMDSAVLVGMPLLSLADDTEQAEVVRLGLGEPLTKVVHWRGRHWQAHFQPLNANGPLRGTVAVYSDVTAQVEAEQALGASARQMRALVEAGREAIVMLDPAGRVIVANEGAVRLAGVALPPGTLLRDVVPPEAAEAVREGLARRAAGEFGRYELNLADRSGSPVWLLVSANPVLGEHGEFLGSLALLTDITAHKLEHQRLTELALVDAVTGVANRATLSDRLEHALSRRTAGVVAVLFCDVDELKATNDRYGHAVGDALLRHIADRINSVLRPADSLARYGGDEFVVVCEDLPSSQEAAALAERVRVAVAVPLPLLTGELLHPSLSIGVATSPPQQPAALLGAADAAAYAAKRAGRNTIRQAP
jgi:diguanylate cyclase (GGDEF)-like protein/PAS domain S-box-containing protein